MSTWGSGYVTDIEYSDGFYSHQAPCHLGLTAIFSGHESPSFEGHFTYCELGCGRGKTSLVLAATHPDAEFHAIDFHPAHIAYARRQAQRAGLTNITFHELSFDEMTGPRGAALPMFDVVTLHGIWTWIAPHLQTAILDFLNARLTPGGLVYVGYNALPGWSQVMPLQRLVIELAAASPQRSDVAVNRAIDQIKRFAEAKIIPDRFSAGVERFLKGGDSALPYLAHEYLNEHWRPVYFADLARSFTAAKLEFVASSELLKNFYNLSLTEAQHKLLAEVSPPELRETLKDFCTDHWFRKDVFQRGATRIPAQRRHQILAAQTLALLRPPPEVFEIGKADGSRWRPDGVVYQTIFRALGQRPRTVTELLRLETLPRNHSVAPVELIGTLVGAGLVGQYQIPSAAALAQSDKLNAALLIDEDLPLTHGAVIAVAAVRNGLALSEAHYPLYASLKRGETPAADELAAAFIERCKMRGGHPIVDARVIEDPAEARAAVTRDYEKKIEQLVPIWRNLGMV